MNIGLILAIFSIVFAVFSIIRLIKTIIAVKKFKNFKQLPEFKMILWDIINGSYDDFESQELPESTQLQFDVFIEDLNLIDKDWEDHYPELNFFVNKRISKCLGKSEEFSKLYGDVPKRRLLPDPFEEF